MATINEITQGSSYQGSAALGGGTFGVGQLDTRPIEDLARYTLLYNRAEYDQRQKDAEKAASEIADLIKYDLTSGIPKDSKVLQEKYDKLIQYVKDNPSAIDYRNKKEWAEYNRMRNDLENDIRGGNVRSTLNTVREKEIAEAKTQEEKDWLKKQLDKNISETDIRTPIQHTPQYDDSIPEITAGPQLAFDVLKQGPNQIFDREHKILDMGKLNAMSISMALELGETPDESTLEGQKKAMARKRNPWFGIAKVFNEAIDGYKDKDGNIDESKLKGTVKNVYGIVKDFNEYVTEKKNEIKAGIYRDKLDRPITFGPGALKEEDYDTINVADGISPDELAKIAIYAKSKSDSYDTKVAQTNDAIERERIAVTRRGQDLDYKVAWKNATKPSGSGTGAATSKIQTPALLFGQHIDRLKNYFENKTTEPDQKLRLQYEKVDQKTRQALGLEEGKYVFFKQDGSYIVNADKKGNGGTPGTIEQFKQALINVTKAGMSDEGVQSEGFQDEAEKGFENIFGTRSGNTIWQGWGKKPDTPAKTESDGTQKKREYKGLDAKGNPIFE